MLLSNNAQQQKLGSWSFLKVQFAPSSTFQVDYAWSGTQLAPLKKDCYLLLNNANSMFLFLRDVRNGSGFAVLTAIFFPVKQNGKFIIFNSNQHSWQPRLKIPWLYS